jgi:hypothetical protein
MDHRVIVKRATPALALTLFALATAADANAQCRPSRESNEAKLLAFYSAPILFGTVSAPETANAWGVRVSAEVVPIPTVDDALTETTECSRPKGHNTRLSPVFGRPRVTVALPFGFAVEGSWVPPVTVGDAEPHLVSGAVSFTQLLPLRPFGGAMVAALRAHETRGRVRGPITCNEDDVQSSDPAGTCYGNAPSSDTFRPDMRGLEAALSAWSAGGRVGVFAGGGTAWLRPRFQVGFTYADGIEDNSRILVNLRRTNVFGGVTYRAASRIDLSAQAHAVPGDVVTLHFAGGWRLR